ncbi:hypothetical protein GS492_24875 [Rhodococcus hoagii]|nr:hypothetical protein [Prescottella equi]
MSLRNRFPAVAVSHVPDPALTEVDPEPASTYLRSAFLESVQRFEPDARLDAFAKVRLFGAPFKEGVFDEQAANIFIRLQHEINSAVSKDDLSEVRIGFARLDRGSVVLNLRPVAPDLPGEDEAPLSAPSKLEAALMKVLDLHDAVEEGDDYRAVSAAQGELGNRLRQLVESLDAVQAGIEVDLSRSNGVRRRSRFGESGRANARRLFEREPHVEPDTVSGLLRTTSTTGLIELTVGKRAVEIEDVPPDIAKQLPWDRQLRFSVLRTVSAAKAGNRRKIKTQFVQWLDRDQLFGS